MRLRCRYVEAAPALQQHHTTLYTVVQLYADPSHVATERLHIVPQEFVVGTSKEKLVMEEKQSGGHC